MAEFLCVSNISKWEKFISVDDGVTYLEKLASYLYSDNKKSKILLLSGSVFNPTPQNILTRAEMILQVLNSFALSATVVTGVCRSFFDFDATILNYIATSCKISMVLTNLKVKDSKIGLFGTRSDVILDFGIKIGIIGLIDEDFFSSLPPMVKFASEYNDWVREGRMRASSLRRQGCDVVLCFTSMKIENELLASNLIKNVDIFLSGNSSENKYPKILFQPALENCSLNSIEFIRNVDSLNSKQNNFQNYTNFTDLSCTNVNAQIAVVDLSKFKEHYETKILMDSFADLFESKLQEAFGKFNINLDTRKSAIRSSENALANYVTDSLRSIYNVDICLLNSGAFRGNREFASDLITLSDIFSMFPYDDPICVIQITGRQLYLALEHGINSDPSGSERSGKFLHFSGLRVEYTSVKCVSTIFVFHRFERRRSPFTSLSCLQNFEVIDRKECFDSEYGQWEILKPDEKVYTVVTRSFLIKGNDGFSMFSNCKDVLTNSESLLAVLLAYFKTNKKEEWFLGLDGRMQWCASNICTPYRDNENIKSNSTFEINILHFNDVYQLEPTKKTDPIGGYARFSTVVSDLKEKHNALVLFSGDVFSPSTESTVTKGKHMIEPLNSLGISAACVGNHDLDFGFESAASLFSQTNFPWVLSNVLNAKNNAPVATSHLFTILNVSNRLKLGIIGLAEKEWIDTLAFIPDHGLLYLDFISEGDRLGKMLKEEYFCDLVIALTHMRLPNDVLAAESFHFVDLILGGHDHDYYCGPSKCGKMVVKSGTEFRNLSLINIKVDFLKQKNELISEWKAIFCEEVSCGYFRQVTTSVTKIDINESTVPNSVALRLIDSLVSDISRSMDKVIGYSRTDLDARFSVTRSGECNIANYTTDMLRNTYDVDLAFIVGGTIRSDNCFSAGPITLKTILLCYPFSDPTTVLRITSAHLWDALENGLSSVPKLDGRFPHFSGVKFVYDPLGLPGYRLKRVRVFHPSQRKLSPFLPKSSLQPFDIKTVPPHDVAIFCGEKGQWIDVQRNDDKYFTLVTRSEGHDGFNVFTSCERLLDSDCGAIIASLFRNHFTTLKIMTQWQKCLSSLSVRTMRHSEMVMKQQNRIFKSSRTNYLWEKVKRFVLMDLRRPAMRKAEESESIDPQLVNLRNHSKSSRNSLYFFSSTDLASEMTIERQARDSGLGCIAPQCDKRILTLDESVNLGIIL